MAGYEDGRDRVFSIQVLDERREGEKRSYGRFHSRI